MVTWTLDPSVTHLNHGSFGACPSEVLQVQHDFRRRLESNPVGFLLHEYQPALEASRSAVANFVCADPEGVVFVQNATSGVNAVLRSLEVVLRPGSEILITNQTYNACRNAAEVSARRCGATVVVADVPFPVGDPQDVVSAVLDRVTDKTSLVMLDHVTSPTGLVLPIEAIIAEVEPDIPVLVDAAHSPGMIELDLTALGASFTTGNCHKWMCAPKGAAFLHVAESYRNIMHAAVISHGWNDGWPNSGSRFHAQFDWAGTDDPTARLSVAAAIDLMEDSHPHGWTGIRTDNHQMVLEGRNIVAEAIGAELPAPASMIGSIAALELEQPAVESTGIFDPLMFALHDTWAIEVPVFTWHKDAHRVLRISAQQYNSLADYERLAEALHAELGKGDSS